MTGRQRLARVVAAGIAAASPETASARDYGQAGAVFRIIEPDLLEVIHRRLLRLDAQGAITAANRAFAARTIARVSRPGAIPGLITATEPRSWLVDPSITVAHDLRDMRGRVVIRAGTRVNPLDTVPLRAPLVFLDGDDPRQLAWAIGRDVPDNAKLILVRGAPLALMRLKKRRFYFDQDGLLTTRLGIRAVPATVSQRGNRLAVREWVLAQAGAAQ